jgi:hypothetical protein
MSLDRVLGVGSDPSVRRRKPRSAAAATGAGYSVGSEPPVCANVLLTIFQLPSIRDNEK